MKKQEENSSVIPDILERFALDSPAEAWEPFGDGHINRTWRVRCREGQRVILQKISERLTDRPDRLMENIVRVTAHLREREKDPRKVLSLIWTKEGESFLQVSRTDSGGRGQGDAASSGEQLSPEGAWRVYRYVEDTICLQAPRDEDDFYKAALAFGRFEQLLKDFPADRLFEPLPDFHNTPVRFRQLHEAIRRDAAGRAAHVEEEIRFLLEREEKMGYLIRLVGKGKLPLRVTHNDTKLNNVLFDRKTMEPLCVVDLDTVMPGLSLYDFGDAIRFGAVTAPEDEKDLDRVSLDLQMYRAFREGFLEACPDLTPLERELLPLGAKSITAEQAARFLTDYLNGDVYYHTSYPGQNLDRTRTQIRLLSHMEALWM